MTAIDWNAPAKLMVRVDQGSELSYDFQALGEGPLASLVARAQAMTMEDRARVLIDAGTQGTFNVGQIVTLALRRDFPRD